VIGHALAVQLAGDGHEVLGVVRPGSLAGPWTAVVADLSQPRPADTEMQRAVREAEKGPYASADYLRPETLASTLAWVLATPYDAVVTELTLRPRGGSGA